MLFLLSIIIDGPPAEANYPLLLEILCEPLLLYGSLMEHSILQKMEILPVTDLDNALHEFVSKDNKMAFFSCVRQNLEETRVSIV